MSGRTLPGIFFFYDINPIQVRWLAAVPIASRSMRGRLTTHRARALQVRFSEARSSFLHFVTSVCAIVGGVFTVSGIIDSGLYHGTRVLRKKMELGKHLGCERRGRGATRRGWGLRGDRETR